MPDFMVKFGPCWVKTLSNRDGDELLASAIPALALTTANTGSSEVARRWG
jgi:hypothetical protein